ncbi:reverse transcriptase domain-containing protein [Tanacetum coccineum]
MASTTTERDARNMSRVSKRTRESATHREVCAGCSFRVWGGMILLVFVGVGGAQLGWVGVHQYPVVSVLWVLVLCYGDKGGLGSVECGGGEECEEGDYGKLCSHLCISNYSVENQIKFSTCTLLGNALTWWNSYVRTVGNDIAYAMTWTELKKKMTDKYCPRTKIKKLEVEQ